MAGGGPCAGALPSLAQLGPAGRVPALAPQPRGRSGGSRLILAVPAPGLQAAGHLAAGCRVSPRRDRGPGLHPRQGRPAWSEAGCGSRRGLPARRGGASVRFDLTRSCTCPAPGGLLRGRTMVFGYRPTRPRRCGPLCPPRRRLLPSPRAPGSMRSPRTASRRGRSGKTGGPERGRCLLDEAFWTGPSSVPSAITADPWRHGACGWGTIPGEIVLNTSPRVVCRRPAP